MVQIVIPNESYVRYSTGVYDPDPENNSVFLDSGYSLWSHSTKPEWGRCQPRNIRMEQCRQPAVDSPEQHWANRVLRADDPQFPRYPHVPAAQLNPMGAGGGLRLEYEWECQHPRYKQLGGQRFPT